MWTSYLHFMLEYFQIWFRKFKKSDTTLLLTPVVRLRNGIETEDFKAQ